MSRGGKRRQGERRGTLEERGGRWQRGPLGAGLCLQQVQSRLTRKGEAWKLAIHVLASERQSILADPAMGKF